MVNRDWLAGGLLCLALGGCGGGDGPVQKCDDLITLTCNRAVECLGEATTGTQAQCVEQVQAQLPCSQVASVNGNYERCMDEMSSFSCDTLFPVDPADGQRKLVSPADCSGVFSR
jgi:hypothetical protein